MQAPNEYKRLWLMQHGETFAPTRDTVTTRNHDATHHLMQQSQIEQALDVAHGGVNRIVLCMFLGRSYTVLLRFEQDNGSINSIVFTECRRPYVRFINYAACDLWKATSPFRQ